MRHIRIMPTPGRFALAVVVPVLALSGCTSGQFGSELSARPKTTAIHTTEAKTLHIPQDEPFSIALPRASREPGLDGTAESDATAKPSGEAAVSAAVTKIGKAEGMFQLGHAFANDTDRQLDLEFSVVVHCEFEAREEPDEGLPDATVGLRLYARDQRGRLLRDLGLVDHTTEHGSTRQQADRTLGFKITLSPGGSVNVFLAGQTKVEIPAERSASAMLKVSGLRFDVAVKPAPAVQAADDGHK
jgi:hypothetical protein